MLALVVIEAANQIYWIEVRGLAHSSHSSGVFLVDLDAFQNLEAGAAILAGNHIRTAAGLSLIAHHTAHADGPVELGTEHLYAFLLGMGQRHLDAEFLVQELLYLVAKLHGRIFVQLAEEVKDLVSELQGNAHKHLLVLCRNRQEFLVGHVVNVLDAHQLVCYLIEVVDEGAVTGGTEQKGSVFLAEGLVVRRYGYGIRGLVLEGEGDIVLDTVLLLIGLLDGANGNLKEGLVLRRDGNGQVAGTVTVSHILLGFYQMLGNGGAYFFRIAVEAENALGLAAIGQAIFFQELLEGFQAVFPGILRRAEEFFRIEGKILDAGSQLGTGGIGRKILAGFQLRQALEHILEHTGSCAGGRYKLALSVNFGLLIIVYCGFYRFGIQHFDASFRSGGAHDLHPGEAILEMLNLLFYLSEAGASVQDLLLIGLAEHSVIVVINIKFLAVVVLAAELFKAVRAAAEQEIVREDGIIVLHHGGNLSLRTAPQVQRSGQQRRVFRYGPKIFECINAEVTGNGLHGHSGTVLLSLVGIAGNVRSGNVTELDEVGIHVGLVAPGVQHQGAQFGSGVKEGGFVHYFTAGGVDEDGAGTHPGKEVFARHASGGLIQRNMHGYNGGILQELVQLHKAFGAFGLGSGRVVQENLDAQRACHLLHLLSHVAHTHDANHGVVQFDGAAGGNAIQGAEDVVCHTAGVAAFGILYLYSVLPAPFHVNVIQADGSTGNHLHAGTGEGFLVALGTGADYNGICIVHGLAVNLTSVHVLNLKIRLQNTL